TAMIPRGLAAAVLATFPLTMGLPNAETYPQIVFSIIMASVIITTIGLGSAKKIPPPEPTSGGYITQSIEEPNKTDIKKN
ncbi:MAG TPA: peptidase, partial [Nitrosarchaeum sp.]|nr:peptidase [Nitrosarchaeum sp.]